MNFLLDTNICVYWLKGDKNIEGKAISVGIDNMWISFVNLSELFYGAYKSEKQNENLSAIQTMMEKVVIIDSSEEICERFGKLKAQLEREGNIIDDADLFIAACALVNEVTLVTNNEKHFSRIKGLKLENWVDS